MNSAANNTPDFLSRATALVERGFSTIPITPRGKAPAGPGATSRTRNLELIKVWAQQWPDANAAVCADENVTILESDDAERLRGLLKARGVTLPDTMTGGASENRPHWFFKRTAECGDSCITVPGLLEFRNGNQYVVGSGSVHPSGAEYRWWKDVPLVPMPVELLDALLELREEYHGTSGSAAPGEHIKTGPYAQLRDAYLKMADPADLLTITDLEVGEDERHYTLTSLAGLLHDGQRSAEDIAQILSDVRDEYFCTGGREVSDDEIQRIATYAVTKDAFVFEPYALPSWSHGTIVFRDEAALQQWLTEHADEFSIDWSVFRGEDVPDQKILMSLGNETLLRSETVNEIFAYRGIGKSVLVAAMVKILTTGGEFLGFQSRGGYRVLLVDGELPKKLLQNRLQDLVGAIPAGLFRVRGLAQTPRGYFAPLSSPAEQEKFLRSLTVWRPDVIIFDTKSSVFKHDTNDQPQLLAMNDFLITLRSQGFAVITTHHAGKNGTQRGRTDNDDILDLVIKLRAPEDWMPGDGARFVLEFDKVRYGDRLESLGAKWSQATGWEIDETATSAAVGLLLKGMAINKVADQLGIGDKTVLKIKRRAERNGTVFPIHKAGRPRKADAGE